MLQNGIRSVRSAFGQSSEVAENSNGPDPASSYGCRVGRPGSARKFCIVGCGKLDDS